MMGVKSLKGGNKTKTEYLTLHMSHAKQKKLSKISNQSPELFLLFRETGKLKVSNISRDKSKHRGKMTFVLHFGLFLLGIEAEKLKYPDNEYVKCECSTKYASFNNRIRDEFNTFRVTTNSTTMSIEFGGEDQCVYKRYFQKNSVRIYEEIIKSLSLVLATLKK